MKKYIVKYLIFIIGLYFLAAGIVLILRSSLGTTPISSVNYVLSLNTPITLGTWTFLINMLLILGQFWFIRDRMTRRDTMEILLQIPFSLLFGVFIDFNMVLTEALHPAHYAAAARAGEAGDLFKLIGLAVELATVVHPAKPIEAVNCQVATRQFLRRPRNHTYLHTLHFIKRAGSFVKKILPRPEKFIKKSNSAAARAYNIVL